MREVIQLDHREGFQVKLRIFFLQRRQQVSEIAERQFRIQSARDVQFGCAFRYRLSGDAQRIVDVVRVSIGLTRRAKEAAELAINVANVRRIEMAIDVEVSRASVLLPPHRVG